MPANQIGILSKAYYRSAGTFASPTWTELTLIRDLTQNEKWDIAEVVTRASRAKRGAPTTLEISITGSIKAVVDDTAYLAIRTARLAGSILDVMFLTGSRANNGEIGWRFEAVVEDATQDQGSGSVLYDSITFRPHSDSANAVQTAIVTTGAPVFTTF
jgi:hypothetical protein